MAYQQIFTGTVPNDNTGDSLYQGASKVNNNFNEIYNAIGTGSASGSIIKPTSISVVSKTLVNNETCIVAGASVVLTLPSTPVNGTEITVILITGVASATIQRPDPFAAAPFIMGLSEPLIIDIPNGFVTLVHYNSDWRIK
jgi:hypothetical protein